LLWGSAEGAAVDVGVAVEGRRSANSAPAGASAADRSVETGRPCRRTAADGECYQMPHTKTLT